MAPELRRGSCALVDPGLPCADGDTCVFRTSETAGTAMFRQLVGHSDTTWTVYQHNPAANFSLKRSEWPVCYRVFGSYAAPRWQARLDRPAGPSCILAVKLL